MSSIHQLTTAIEVPSSVRELIASLRSQLRQYALLSGVLFVVSTAVITFWLTSGIDAGWFALQRLELPAGLRYIVFCVMAAGAAWLLLQYIGRPLLRRTDDRDLALLLERRFPQFQDRLMTTVEGQSGYPDSGKVVHSMLQRTVNKTASMASSVNADDVFDFGPLKKRGWLTGLLALSVLIGAIARPGSLEQWWSAFVLCEDAYHLRTSALDFTVVAQPDDRRLAFRDMAGTPTYLHPRGEDLELEMRVPAGLSAAGTPWVRPERVRVDVIRENGSRSRTYVAPTPDGNFRFILTRLQETVEIEVLAGDFRTPLPLRVESVTPPGINAMLVDCQYPDYTGWNTERERRVAILGSEALLPMGTEFRFQADSNKPLQAVRITTDFFELSGDRVSSQLVAREGYTATIVADQPLLSEDGLSFFAEFRLASTTDSVSTDTESSNRSNSSVLPIPSNTAVRFFLHDEDDIISTSPESLRIRGIEDTPPIIAVRTAGVSNSITRRAIVPIEGTIQDDYRVVSAGFQFLVDDATDWRPRNFRNDFQAGLTYSLDGDQGTASERFDVQSLELTDGQTLALTVVASDGCTVPGPNRAQAEPIVFRIVSNEELLSLLYTRELALRRRFEEVIANLETVRNDLAFHRDVAERIEAAATAKDIKPEDRAGLSNCASHSGDVLRRQNNELQAIVKSFDDIVQELLNNAIPPQQLAETMRSTIVVPMQAVTTNAMVIADRSVSRFRVAATSGRPASQLVQTANQDVIRVIDELKVILESVRDMAEFHEALSDLKSILEEQQRILDETKREQIKSLSF